MHRNYLITGSAFGAIAVCLGAFGAHGLKKIVPAETVNSFQTGVQYQMYHSLALLLVAIIFEKLPGKWTKWAGISFIAGILLFSGSLYLLTVCKAMGLANFDLIGILTPIGGLFFIAGWLCLLTAVIKKP